MYLHVGLREVWGDGWAGWTRWKAAKRAWRAASGLPAAAQWQALPDGAWWRMAASDDPVEREARVDVRLAALGLARDDLPDLAERARQAYPDLFAAPSP